MSRLIVGMLAALLAQSPPADAPPAADAPAENQLPEPMQFQQQLMDEARNLGPWEDHAGLEANAINSVFESNGWNSESDQYARDLVLRVNAVPPWNAAERQEVFLGGIEQRYGLSADQRRLLNRRMQLESMRITMNHFPTIAPIAMEAVKTRSGGQPYTAEQVARWSKTLRPLAEEARESVERVSRELARTMTPEQCKILEADMKALIRRHRSVTEQMSRWEQGEWRPEQWGLANDPIQNGQRAGGQDAAQLAAAKRAAQASLREARAPVEPGANGQPVTTVSASRIEGEWERYVREFGEKHAFSESQKASARGILKDLLTRAERFDAANSDRLRALQQQTTQAADAAQRARLQKELTELQRPINDMFEELKRRLQALLTAEQRSIEKDRA